MRSRLFVLFGLQVASDPDPSENLQPYQIAAGTYFGLRWLALVFRRLRSPALVNFGLCDSDKELGCVLDLVHHGFINPLLH